MSYACMYCKYYKYDEKLSKVYWKLTQDGECPQIGRCTFGKKTCGNAVLATGWHSDGTEGCNDYEEKRDTMKYRVGDVFESDKRVFGIVSIQYQYSPRVYRCATIGGGGWSQTEEELDGYKMIWRAKDEQVEN